MARADEPQAPHSPDLAYFPEDEGLNDLIGETRSVHLKAMQEPSLWELSRRDGSATVYRFLWLATHEHPIAVRLARAGEGYVLHVARHDGPPGLTAGRLSVRREVKLSARRGEELVARIERSTFWTSPARVKESRGIADGDVILIEGVKGGRYHLIERAGSTAGESYKAFCRSLLELADEPGLLETWDRRRRSERERPDYLAEPPQTEDRGNH